MDKTVRSEQVNVIALVRGEEHFVFVFDPKRRTELLRLLGRYAADPSMSFNWYDAAVLSQKIRDLLPASLPRLPQLNDSVATYRRLEAEIPIPRRAPGVHEAAAFDQPLFVRGQITHPGEAVPRRFLEMFDDRPFRTSLSGRLELADKVASPENPLTARVMVNRLWHHVFGYGLVGTVDNFGRLGQKPTHPELLDYLSSRFIKHGWSIKETIRFLVMSRAFQQTALASADARRIDPRNELLSHAHVRRLEAEAIRDAVLAVSGQLDVKMYGPGVNVYYVAKTEGGGPRARSTATAGAASISAFDAMRPIRFSKRSTHPSPRVRAANATRPTFRRNPSPCSTIRS